jgi:hypothetical protein
MYLFPNTSSKQAMEYGIEHSLPWGGHRSRHNTSYHSGISNLLQWHPQVTTMEFSIAFLSKQ